MGLRSGYGSHWLRVRFLTEIRELECYGLRAKASDVTVWGASFVRAGADRETRFRETCRLLRESNARALASSPTNLVVSHTVRASPGNDWISVENCASDLVLETISLALSTTAVTVYAVDEKFLQFSYVRFDDGRAVRALEFLDDTGQEQRGSWTQVEGEPESWELSLFTPDLMEQYAQYAPDEVYDLQVHKRIKQGLSIPWACNGRSAEAIARSLQLPWEPLAPNKFPSATEIEVIPGSSEGGKNFLGDRTKPWWKFW